VVVAEAMRQKSNARLAAGSVAGVLQTELGGVRRVLGMAQGGSEERQSKQGRKSFEGNRHHGLRWF
jgi:hypothetical protein